MRTHPLHVGYLVVGLVFLGVAGSWALRSSGVVDASADRWLVPAVLVVAGAVGLVASVARGVRRSRGTGTDDDPGTFTEQNADHPHAWDGDPR